MAYQKQIWENAPSTNSPLSADRLNHMEDGIDNAYKQIKNSYNTSTNDSYSCNYINNVIPTITTVSDNELKYIKIDNVVFVSGYVVMNAQTKTFTLLYKPTYTTTFPSTGIFSTTDAIASYGNISINNNSTTANIYMNTAATRATINIVYITND